MFGNLGNMFGMIQEAKKKMDEIKKKLDTITVNGDAGNGKVRVTATGNRRITNIEIDQSILADKEQLEDLILSATNKALDEAQKVSEKELKGATKGILPDIPGLF